jgi:shikimate kinase
MNIDKFIKSQFNERYKSFILCGSGLTGKTTLAKQLEVRFDGTYIDVLQKISADEEMSARINALKPDQVFKLIDLKESEFIITDHMDIVFSLWTETQQKEFIRKLDMKSNGSCLMVILHNYKILEQENVIKKNSLGNKRIINIAEII